MKLMHRSILFSFVFILPLFLSAQDFPKAELDGISSYAKQYISLLNKEIPDSKEADITTEDFRKNMPLMMARPFWDASLKSAGSFQKIKSLNTYPYKNDKYKSVVVAQMDSASLKVTLMHNKEGKISGLFFGMPSARPGPEPSYASASKYTESEIIIRNGEWPLPATVTMPTGDGPFPAVVLVHGSGPNDRDETIGRNKPFRDLAWGLASNGIAVIRYDKRTNWYAGAMKEYEDSITLKEEVIDDAVKAVDVMRGMKGVDKDKVYVVGHSLGAMCAPWIATDAKEAAGAVMLAGTSRGLEDLILEQYEYIFNLDDTISPNEKSQLRILKDKVQMVKSPVMTARIKKEKLPLNLPGSYWMSLKEYDIDSTIIRLEKPVLIVQGLRDYQVTRKDFDHLQKQVGNQAHVQFKMFPTLDHLMRPGEGKSKPGDYNRPGNVSEDVIDSIVAWIKE